MFPADKLIDLRNKNGWSQEELAEKLNVSGQTVSEWERGASAPDADTIGAMSALFGVGAECFMGEIAEDETPTAECEETTDEESPEEIKKPPVAVPIAECEEPIVACEEAVPEETAEEEISVRHVPADDAYRYIALVEKLSKQIAIGAMLCVLSPILLILFNGFSDPYIMVGSPWMGEGLAMGLGLSTLIALVGVAIALFIINWLKLSEFSYLSREPISLDDDVHSAVEQMLQEYHPRFGMMIIIGVLLCMVSPIPLMIAAIFDLADVLLVWGLAILLAFCAVGVVIIVRACFIHGSYQRLLQRGFFTVERKPNRHRESHEAIRGAYWCAVTLIYVLWSFLSNDWKITWVVWVIAVAGKFALEEALKKNKK